MKSAPTLAFDYRPSRVVGIAVAVITLAAVAACWASGLATAWRILASGFALAAGARALRRHQRPPFRRIAWRASGWSLVDGGGDERTANLVGRARVGALIALDFALDRGGAFRPLLLPDNLDADTRRRLRVLLARAEILRTD